jgi:hypothetical protein
MKSKNILALSVGLIGLIGANANAAFVNAYATWSGASFGNTASASATFKVDTDYLAITPNPVYSEYQWITDIELTVTGAAVGNGTFTSVDFFNAYFNIIGAVDFSQDLVGQPNFFDFNLFNSNSFNNPESTPSAAPNGFLPNVMMINSGAGDPFDPFAGGEQIQLTSLTTTAVPEPSCFALLALGAGGLIARRRRAVVA